MEIAIEMKDTIKSLRVKFGYSQAQVAERLDVAIPTYRAWERDSSKVPYAKIKMIEQIYQRNQDQIFFGSSDSFSELLRSKLATATPYK